MAKKATTPRKSERASASRGSDYYACRPSADAKAVTILLGPGARTDTPPTDEAVLSQLVETFGIKVPVLMWRITPFFSRYFGGKWQVSWEARISVRRAARISADVQDAAFPIATSGNAREEPQQWQPVRVIADFDTLPALKTCKAAVQEHARAGGWNAGVYDRYRTRELPGAGHQLFVDITEADTQNTEDVERVKREADAVLAICREHDAALTAPPPLK